MSVSGQSGISDQDAKAAGPVRIDHYRPDIDGVRGVAVLFVLAYHCSKPLLPGGFVGVDAFFVISGYLISSILFREIRAGRFSILTFYARRTKRIFPALTVVLAATLALGWLFLFPSEYANLGKHTAGGATFISNILLWKDVGYFDASSEHKPLLHLWSLGVEEQFYIFFPALVWTLARLRLPVATILALLLAVSLAAAQYAVKTHPWAAFYLPATRLWELLIGCILAALEHRPPRGTGAEPRSPGPWREAASAAGFTLILASGLLLSERQPFPGLWAAAPTVGTALSIAAGPRAFVNRRILGSRVLVAVGLISYPLYLWHWPLLSLGRIVAGQALSWPMTGALAGASFLLAWLTYRWIEAPFRFGRGMSGTLKVGGLCTAMAVVLAAALAVMTGLVPSRIGLDPASRAITEAEADWAYPFEPGRRGRGRPEAEFGDLKAGHATLFVGDSHMQQYWPRIDRLLKDTATPCRPVLLLTSGGSPMLPGVVKRAGAPSQAGLFELGAREGLRPEVSTVVFGCFWEAYFIGAYPDRADPEISLADDPAGTPLRIDSPQADRVFLEFGRAIAELTSAGKRVVVITSGPTCTAWAPRAGLSRIPFLAQPDDPNRSSILRKDLEEFIRPVKLRVVQAALANGATVVDPLDAFEEQGVLRGRSATGDPLYKDSNHMRPFYVRERASFLDALIRAEDTPR